MKFVIIFCSYFICGRFGGFIVILNYILKEIWVNYLIYFFIVSIIFDLIGYVWVIVFVVLVDVSYCERIRVFSLILVFNFGLIIKLFISFKVIYIVLVLLRNC